MVAEPFGNVPDADHIRSKPVALDLGPGDRHGNWGATLGPDRIRRDRRLRVGVSVDVEEETALALLFGELGGQVIRVRGCQPLGESIGKKMDLLESRTNGDGRDHVQPARARGLDEGDQLQLLEQGLERECGLANEAEVFIRRIKVEHHLIGLVGRLDA